MMMGPGSKIQKRNNVATGEASDDALKPARNRSREASIKTAGQADAIIQHNPVRTFERHMAKV
jgi:hypothetical protein